MTQAIHWAPLCGNGYHEPFVLTRGGEKWTCATNCHAILYVRGQLLETAEEGPAGRDAWKPFRTHARPTYRVSWFDFAAWCRQDDLPREACRDCEGSTADDCECCDGVGSLYAPDWRPLLDEFVDRSLVWRYLRQVCAPTLLLSIPCAEGHTPLAIVPESPVFESCAWKLCVMPALLRGETPAPQREPLPLGILDRLQGAA